MFDGAETGFMEGLPTFPLAEKMPASVQLSAVTIQRCGDVNGRSKSSGIVT